MQPHPPPSSAAPREQRHREQPHSQQGAQQTQPLTRANSQQGLSLQPLTKTNSRHGNASRNTTPAAAPEPRLQPTSNEESNTASDGDQRNRQTEPNEQTRPKERRDNQRKEQESHGTPPPYKETFGPANLSKRQRKCLRQAERHQNNSAPPTLTEREADINKQRRGQSPSPPPEEQDTQRRAHPPLHPKARQAPRISPICSSEPISPFLPPSSMEWPLPPPRLCLVRRWPPSPH
ncbi:hypothetical protein HPB47_015220 [Ixodes persulcatus]|uniref:Uncharacterized protein n=1 Tax=Ixodes persulcatus TaxID=34615 RepID=A0AC60QWK8_IXOPE|nr:hypothetical protein HPB47_015220 [Ixodes persulcatus]